MGDLAALGSVAGIVGAGGNAGAVLAAFLFKTESLAWPQALMILGISVTICAAFTGLVRFSEAEETAARDEMQTRLAAAGTPALASAA